MRLLLLFALTVAICAYATPSPACEAAAPSSRARCSCVGRGSVGRAMDSADLVAIAVPDSTVLDSTAGAVYRWPLRIERAWKWPGGGAAPPRRVVVSQRADPSACSIRIVDGERQLVVAWLRPADGALVLGHKCATPWGAVDTLGPTARNIRRSGGDRAMHSYARELDRVLDSLRSHGPRRRARALGSTVTRFLPPRPTAMRYRTALATSLHAVALSAVLSSAGAAQVTAIRAGRVVDPDAGTVATNQVILVEKGKITAIGADVAIPGGATVVDLSNATVSPGLVDAHTHLCLGLNRERDAHNYFNTTTNDPDAFRAVEGVANAQAMLAAGFTTVRDVGNEGNYACVQVRKAIELGMIVGPTLLTAGRIIAPYGGQFRLQPDRPTLAEPEYFFADTRDEMVKGIRENIHFGAAVIKIVVDDQRYFYSTEEIRFMKDEAARAGFKLAAHAWTREGAHNAAEAGVASIEHGPAMTDEDLALAKRNGVALVGTEFLSLVTDSTVGQESSIPHGQWVDRLRRAYRIGVTLVYGSDATDMVKGKTRGELAMMGIDPWVEAGVPAPVILRAMTTNATRLLGVDTQRGTLKPGMAADLIATPDNPLADITTLKRVMFVMKDGRVIKAPERAAGRAVSG